MNGLLSTEQTHKKELPALASSELAIPFTVSDYPERQHSQTFHGNITLLQETKHISVQSIQFKHQMSGSMKN